LSQQLKLNAQLGGHHIAPIQHVDEVTSANQRWQFVTLGYYIPKAIILSQLTPIVEYFTFEPIPTLNPTTTYSELEHNQFLN
jgi:hypothetical protein